MSPRRARAYGYLFLVVIIWGLASPVIKFTLQGIDPLPFLTYRFFISFIISLGFFLYKIKKGKRFKRLRAHIPLAIIYSILAVPLALGVLFFGLDNSTVLDLTLISIMGPLLVVAGGSYFFREHITRREKVGIFIVLIGIILNSFYPVIRSEGIKLTANILLLLYLLSDSASILIAKQATRYKIKSANLTNLAFIIGFLTFLPITLYIYGIGNFVDQVISLPFKYHLGVWYMSIFSGTVAYYLFVKAYKSIEVSEAALFNYLQPVVTIPLAIFWLKETLSTHFVVGAVVITIGLSIAEYKKNRYNNKV